MITHHWQKIGKTDLIKERKANIFSFSFSFYFSMYYIYHPSAIPHRFKKYNSLFPFHFETFLSLAVLSNEVQYSLFSFPFLLSSLSKALLSLSLPYIFPYAKQQEVSKAIPLSPSHYPFFPLSPHTFTVV